MYAFVYYIISSNLESRSLAVFVQTRLCFQSFLDMLIDGQTRKGLAEIKDLAKRLAISFGVDLNRVRKPLMALHM